MSRSGYSSDLDQQQLAMWRGRVASSIRGVRGQKLLRDIAAFMDAMPVRELAAGSLKTPGGDFCTLGCAMAHRGLGVPMGDFNEDSDSGAVAERLGIAECLAQEIAHENDDLSVRESPSERWVRMRKWVAENTKKSTS